MNFLYLNSDKMGEGDPELGRKLLLVFLEKLAASDVTIDVVGCVNNGIFLTTAPDSPALASLRQLVGALSPFAMAGSLALFGPGVTLILAGILALVALAAFWSVPWRVRG